MVKFMKKDCINGNIGYRRIFVALSLSIAVGINIFLNEIDGLAYGDIDYVSNHCVQRSSKKYSKITLKPLVTKKDKSSDESTYQNKKLSLYSKSVAILALGNRNHRLDNSEQMESKKHSKIELNQI